MGEGRSRSFYVLAAFFTAYVLFLYGPMFAIYILSFQGPDGGLTFPMNGVSLVWFSKVFSGTGIVDIGAAFKRSLKLGLVVMVLTVLFFAWGQHLWLPGVWMLCYGQGALATSAYAPAAIRWLGMAILALGCVTLGLGQAWGVLMMAIAFGMGHVGLGTALMLKERRERSVKLYRDVA